MLISFTTPILPVLSLLSTGFQSPYAVFSAAPRARDTALAIRKHTTASIIPWTPTKATTNMSGFVTPSVCMIKNQHNRAHEEHGVQKRAGKTCRKICAVF